MRLSVVIITRNEEANLGRTLRSVQALVADGQGEVIVVDSGSTDGTVEIAKSYGARVFVEEWKGFAAQKNGAISKANAEWILSLDADEEADDQLVKAIVAVLNLDPALRKDGYWMRRKNLFLGRWMKHGGFWPDPKLRLFRRGCGRVEDRRVHETVQVTGATGQLWDGRMGFEGALVHHSYPTLSDYIEHMNRYSSLAAEMVAAHGGTSFPVLNIVLRPLLTFLYNYCFRLGFLDGREGFLLHVNHAVYVSWKYAKAWELARRP
jgi:glycosyltransferase involved in cell wall biosynthesis